MSTRGAELLTSLPPFFPRSDFYFNYCPFCLACTPPQNTNFPPHLYSARLSSHFLSSSSSFSPPPLHIQPFFSGRPRSLHLPPSRHLFIRSFRDYPPSFLEFNSTDGCQNRSDPSDEDANTHRVGTQSQITHHTRTHTSCNGATVGISGAQMFAMLLYKLSGAPHTCSHLPQVGDPIKDVPHVRCSRIKV